MPAAAPQLISTNRPFYIWIKKFRKFPAELQHAISKRIVFFRLPDAPLVKAELRKRRREDMTAMVVACLEREKKFLRQCGREDASTATTPSEVGGSDMLSNSDSVESNCICSACEYPCQVLSDGVCAECFVCPPASEEGSRLEESDDDELAARLVDHRPAADVSSE